MKKKQENIDEVLLLKIIENRADDLEKDLFKEWLDSSAENAELYAQLEKTHQISSHDTFSTQTNWKQVENKFSAGYKVPEYIDLPESNDAGKVIKLNVLLRVAAVFIFLIGITFLFKTVVFNPEQLIVSGKDLKNNEPYQLADGSMVYLHGNSEISFRKDFSTKNRAVILKGEAFFEIEKDEKLPFLITSNETTTRVKGTSFNVFSDSEGKVKVSVVTGVVEFYVDNKNIVELRAGEQGSYNPLIDGIEKTAIIDPNFQAWKTGIITFGDTPLPEAFDLLSRQYSRVFQFTEEENTVPTITTTFDNQSLEAVLEELNLLLNTKNEFKNDTIIFKPDK